MTWDHPQVNSRVYRDLQQLGESVWIEVTKEGMRFISEGDTANGSIHLRPAGDKVLRSMVEREDQEGLKRMRMGTMTKKRAERSPSVRRRSEG